jgi:hypothetical protein
MQVGDGLVLRDIHVPPAPPWWPPAPGWWMLVTVLLLAAAGFAWWHLRRRRRARAVARLFDDALARAGTPGERIAAMSELLRRAARRVNPQADKLQGEDWLRFLDKGLPQPVFATGAGAVLRDGAFRRDVPAEDAEALRAPVRARFIEWMGRRR